MTEEDVYKILETEEGWMFEMDGKKTGPFETRKKAVEAAEHDVQIDNLEEGLEDTFPASDPVSATIPKAQSD